MVVATGPFQVPRTPAFAQRLDPEIVQLHSSAYRTPDAIPEGAVLVVGGGNTGFQIAEELAGSHEVHLAVGSRQTPLPQRIFGRDLFWYLEATGLIRKTTASRIGRRMAGRDTLIGSQPPALCAAGTASSSTRAPCRRRERRSASSDGTSRDVRSVIWATGFGVDHSWIDVPVFDEEGRLVHQRGVTQAPGSVLPGADVAAHQRLGTARLGQG